MPGSEEFVQSAVHALEAGGLSVWVKRGAVALGIIAIAAIYLYQFRGLSTSQAMDQAQIGRAIASGEGWKTKLARPRAVGQLQYHGKSIPEKIWVDTYNAPLPPLVNAIALLLVKPYWKMTPRTLIYAGDRAIAMSVYVIRAFIELRDKIATNAAILKRLAEIDKTLLLHDSALRDVYKKLLPLLAPTSPVPKKQIGFHS